MEQPEQSPQVQAPREHIQLPIRSPHQQVVLSVPVTTSVTITALPTATISYAGTPFCTSLATAQSVTLTGQAPIQEVPTVQQQDLPLMELPEQSLRPPVPLGHILLPIPYRPQQAVLRYQ